MAATPSYYHVTLISVVAQVDFAVSAQTPSSLAAMAAPSGQQDQAILVGFLLDWQRGYMHPFQESLKPLSGTKTCFQNMFVNRNHFFAVCPFAFLYAALQPHSLC